MSQWRWVRSSNLNRIRYFRKTLILLVEFKNPVRLYAYARVPWSVYMSLCKAESKGSYHNRNIAYRFDYQRISPAAALSLGLD